MRTRCPACSTTFRVTSEQLRLKAGKVRCGQCMAVFNAFESLIEEEAPVGYSAPQSPPPASEPAQHPREVGTPTLASPSAPLTEPAPPLPEPKKPVEIPAISEESIAESSLAAREAGLLAPRELNDAPGYNRWAAGALASEAYNRIEDEQSVQVTWPFMLGTLILSLLLAAQLLYQFRTVLVQRWPDASQLYTLAAVDVPLPQNSELVGIEVSDLQADNARGLLVLQATLRNRANYPQAWPALELTLTDTQDKIISRRVLEAEAYLPPGVDTHAFASRSDMAIRLWLDAKEVGAAGYRLYLFYP